jgi:soluble lytic murein transglycosylase-like protein
MTGHRRLAQRRATLSRSQEGSEAPGETAPLLDPPAYRHSYRPITERPYCAPPPTGTSGALLAAQLMAESNFNPYATSPAGAQGIAQFIPSTAAAYGLHDPFDPVAAMEAQAHLMSDLIHQLGSVQLALAAYNAGPAPVEACNCIPPYPETQAYVTRILALIGGSGALAVPEFEVRLIA